MMDIFKSTEYHLHESLINVLEVTQYFYMPLPHSTVPESFRPRQSAWMCQLIKITSKFDPEYNSTCLQSWHWGAEAGGL